MVPPRLRPPTPHAASAPVVLSQLPASTFYGSAAPGAAGLSRTNATSSFPLSEQIDGESLEIAAISVARQHLPAMGQTSLVDTSLFGEREILDQCARKIPEIRLALEDMVVNGGKYVPTHRRQDSASPELCDLLVHLTASEDCTSICSSKGGISLPYLDSDR